jgi:hypothetical protein
MAAFFKIAQHEATLLFQIGRALGHPAPAQQAELGMRQCRRLRAKQASHMPNTQYIVLCAIFNPRVSNLRVTPPACSSFSF